MSDMSLEEAGRGTVLVVDDDDQVREMVARVLAKTPFATEGASSGDQAIAMLRRGSRYDAIIIDLQMPGMTGVEAIRQARELDVDASILVLTANPSLESAIALVEQGGFRYLTKPVEPLVLRDAVTAAVARRHLTALRKRALDLTGGGTLNGNLVELDQSYEEALKGLWVAFQPVVKLPDELVFGYEALVRSSEEVLSTPPRLLEAGERLGRVREIGRAVRRAIAERFPDAPPESVLFVNLHAADLMDPDLCSPSAPLTRHAGRIVLEITERASLHEVDNLSERVRALRGLGFRIAVDDLGAGYAGLATFSEIEPDVVKLDMSLIRDIDTSSRKASLVRSMIKVCQRELGIIVVCEGVETEAERDTLLGLGAGLLQGYLFGRPERTFRRGSVFAPASSSRPVS